MQRNQDGQRPVWVVESGPAGEVGAAYALAGRLNCSFRRLKDIALTDEENQPPRFILTSGFRAGLAGLRLRRRFSVPVVHCSDSRILTTISGRLFDQLVLSAPVPVTTGESRIIPALGPLSIVSPALYRRAARLWHERLEHLPHPRIAVRLDAGWKATPAEVMAVMQGLEQTVQAQNGALLISIGAGVPDVMAEKFLSGLYSCFKLVWRHGEPDDDPTLGFIGCADAVILSGGRLAALAETTSCDIPVFLGHVPGRFGDYNHLARSLLARDVVRIFDSYLLPWERQAFDETGRVAAELQRRLACVGR
jgi:mitochondrial fission protein ELM1